MIEDTCSAHWANEDRRYKGSHTCHLLPGHASAEHECACRARTDFVRRALEDYAR